MGGIRRRDKKIQTPFREWEKLGTSISREWTKNYDFFFDGFPNFFLCQQTNVMAFLCFITDKSVGGHFQAGYMCQAGEGVGAHN